MKIPKWRKAELELLPRAAMNVYELNTGVILPTHTVNDDRILISQASDDAWADCVSILFRKNGDDDGVWYGGHYSPARCRLIAMELLRRAEEIEKREGAMNIDKPSQFMLDCERRSQ
jgi:hypothetical protein